MRAGTRRHRPWPSAELRCPTLSELPPPPAGRTGWPWTEETEQLPDAISGAERWPRVSVVTPSYNQGQYIEECIRSVLLQGYPDLEYIIMDGGSTDGSVDVIGKYRRWLAYTASGPDGGQTRAINDGWARSTGDVLAYINTDDCYLEGAVATAARAVASTPGAGMVYGNATIVDESGHEMRTWQARPFSLTAMLTDGSVVPQPTVFFTRTALASVGNLDEQWHMIMDYELTIRVGMGFRSVCLTDTLARFRDHSRSKSRTQFRRLAAELIRLLSDLETRPGTTDGVRQVKQLTLSRIHYEWAMACLAKADAEGAAARHLRQSLRLHPRYAFLRPIQTAYIGKEVVRRHVGSRRPFRSPVKNCADPWQK